MDGSSLHRPPVRKFRFKRTIPTLVNVRAAELRKLGYDNIQAWLDASPHHLYIGRHMRINIGQGQWCYLPNSKWHNPFTCVKVNNRVVRERTTLHFNCRHPQCVIPDPKGPIDTRKSENRDQIVDDYETYARTQFTPNELRELKGKVLGCWCTPQRCHGDVLIKLYRELT